MLEITGPLSFSTARLWAHSEVLHIKLTFVHVINPTFNANLSWSKERKYITHKLFNYIMYNIYKKNIVWLWTYSNGKVLYRKYAI